MILSGISAAPDLLTRQLVLFPSDSEAWRNLSLALVGLDRQSAFRSATRGLVINRADAVSGLLVARLVLEEMGYEQAIQLFQRILTLSPGGDQVVLDYGVALSKAPDWVSAQRWFDRALVAGAMPEIACLYQGIAAFNSGDVGRALALMQRCSQLSPLSAQMWFNYGLIQHVACAFDCAILFFDRASVLDPSSAEPLYNSALSLLASASFVEGWRRYEYRWRSSQFLNLEHRIAELQTTRPSLSLARYAEECVLVWAEQGVGDEVMFGSMLGEFRGMVGKLLVQLDRRLIPLFRRSLPDDVEFFERGTVVPEDRYDSHIAIGSLGQYLRPTLESFAGKGGKYLWADPERVQAMREWLSVQEGERVIGLSWRSSNPETGAARSLALSDLVKSLQAPGVRFVNLQYGDVAAEIEALERDEGIKVLQCPGLDTTDDLDGLAALIEACDEVISIGNATAHLAGALGKKTTVLLPKLGVKAAGNKVMPGWRWLGQPSTCLWYDSVSLYRMYTNENNWVGALNRLSVSR